MTFARVPNLLPTTAPAVAVSQEPDQVGPRRCGAPDPRTGQHSRLSDSGIGTRLPSQPNVQGAVLAHRRRVRPSEQKRRSDANGSGDRNRTYYLRCHPPVTVHLESARSDFVPLDHTSLPKGSKPAQSLHRLRPGESDPGDRRDHLNKVKTFVNLKRRTSASSLRASDSSFAVSARSLAASAPAFWSPSSNCRSPLSRSARDPVGGTHHPSARRTRGRKVATADRCGSRARVLPNRTPLGRGYRPIET